MRPIILLPIAGKAQRFVDVGVTVPKPMIPCAGKTVIEWAMQSLKTDHCDLVFVGLREQREKLADFLSEKFGPRVQFVWLEFPTDGALTTCMIAAEMMERSHSLTIFTPDAYCQPAFDPYIADPRMEGILSLYPSKSPSCSYAKTAGRYVMEVAEKQVISPYATTGIYYFSSVAHFLHAAKWAKANEVTHNGEYYIAPIYNGLIDHGFLVGYELVNKVDVLGTPGELEVFCENHSA